MAIYEFGCGSCEVVVEKMQPYDDPHPSCCGVEMERLISMPANPVVMGLGSYEAEYGSGAHLLNQHDRKVRNSRECRAMDLQPSKPGRTNPDEAKKIKELSERGKYV